MHSDLSFDPTKDGLVILDESLLIISFNEYANRLMLNPEIQKQIKTGSCIFDYIPQRKKARFSLTLKKVLKGESVSFSYYYPDEEGNGRHIESSISPISIAGNKSGVCILGRDITKDIKARQDLEYARMRAERSEEKFRRVFDQSPVPNWIYDIDTLQILEVNREAIRHYGYSRKKFLSMTIRDLRPPEDQDHLTIAINRIKDNQKSKDGFWRHIKKNGDIIIVDVTGLEVDFGGHRARMVICQDVTERLETEAALSLSNERFRYAIKATSDAIWDLDIKASNVFLGEGFKTLFDHDEVSETVDISWITDKLHAEDKIRVLEKINDLINSTSENRWADEYRFRRADGTYALISNVALLIRDKNGKPLKMIGAMRDITENRDHLSAIQSQNDRLREIAWFQSHIVRAPVARLMGLADLATANCSEEELYQILPLLKESIGDLDKVIKEIVVRTEEINIPKAS